VGVRVAWIVALAACHHGAAEPAAPTCTAAAEHVRELLGSAGERSIRIRDVFAARCDADAWSAEVRTCVVATDSLRSPRHCKAKLTREQRSALDHELTAIDASAAPRLPATCHEYRALIDRLGACRAIPQATRAALEQGYRDLTSRWMRAGVNTLAIDGGTLEAKCRAMAESMRQAIAPTCGW
jgi:hypothetical protein